MINQVIDDIILAENEADQIKKDAENEANAISVSLAAEVEELRKHYYEKTKEQTDAIKAQAEVDAQAAFDEVLASATDDAAAVIKKAEKSAQKVSDGIFNKMVKLSSKKVKK